MRNWETLGSLSPRPLNTLRARCCGPGFIIEKAPSFVRTGADVFHTPLLQPMCLAPSSREPFEFNRYHGRIAL